jgi:hypothetical protein
MTTKIKGIFFGDKNKPTVTTTENDANVKTKGNDEVSNKE